MTELDLAGLWLGRVERESIGPCVVTLRDGLVTDITSRDAPTTRDVLERDDAIDFLQNTPGNAIGKPDAVNWLAPCDLQAVKACGVTFAGSMIERVIEEQAAGDAGKA